MIKGKARDVKHLSRSLSFWQCGMSLNREMEKAFSWHVSQLWPGWGREQGFHTRESGHVECMLACQSNMTAVSRLTERDEKRREERERREWVLYSESVESIQFFSLVPTLPAQKYQSQTFCLPISLLLYHTTYIQYIITKKTHKKKRFRMFYSVANMVHGLMIYISVHDKEKEKSSLNHI